MFLDKYIDGGWTLAIRDRVPGEESFRGESGGKFTIVKNPWRYWCADPFLFCHQGKRYIFCEACDIFKDRGVLAYRMIDEDGRISKMRVCMDTGFHLSYPNVFSYNGQIYMIPETAADGQVQVYRATQFPDKWEKCAVLLDHISACDTNLIQYEEQWYLMTLVYDTAVIPYRYDKLYTFVWNGQEFIPCMEEPAVEGAKIARNAGGIFQNEEMFYRVSQNCHNHYGEEINFHQIKKLTPTCYEEEIVGQIGVADIVVDSVQKYDGIHTYNVDDRYEIIDLQKKKWFRIERFIYLLNNKIRGIFKNCC